MEGKRKYKNLRMGGEILSSSFSFLAFLVTKKLAWLMVSY